MGRPVRLRALPPKSAVGAVAVILLPPFLCQFPQASAEVRIPGREPAPRGSRRIV